MPRYSFINRETQEALDDVVMTYEELLVFRKEHPELDQVFTPFGYVDPVTVARKKPERGFNDMMIEMKKKVGGKNTIKTYY